MESEGKERHSISLQKSECKTVSVNVYNDRAEITRSVAASLKPGINEIEISGLSTLIDKDSIRVSGKGNATILEVSHNAKYITEKEMEAKSNTLELEKNRLVEEKKKVEEELERNNKERVWFLGWAETLKSTPKMPSGENLDEFLKNNPLLSDSNLNNIDQFLTYYKDRLEHYDNESRKLYESIKKLNKEIAKYQSELGNKKSSYVHQILIILETQKEIDTLLLLSYVVTGARWSASYDARVQSNNNNISITYYGTIENNTEEDWNDVEVSLSTAQPAVGGSPPELYTQYVTIKDKYEVYNSLPFVSNIAVMQTSMNTAVFRSERANDNISIQTTSASESATCANFKIPRNTTILSDGKPRKVVIAVINLDAEFTYTVIPKLSQNAYLKASIINSTKDITLLAGTVNVFMDENFVTKSSIAMVVPTESFSLFLGVDGGIKIEYSNPNKHVESSGLFQKIKTMSLSQEISITNNKALDITIAVFEQLPKSNTSNIKVRLITPEIEEGGWVKLTNANNLEWTVDIKPKEKISIPFRYSIEYPGSEEINLS